jgi:hypothetical protein
VDLQNKALQHMEAFFKAQMGSSSPPSPVVANKAARLTPPLTMIRLEVPRPAPVLQRAHRSSGSMPHEQPDAPPLETDAAPSALSEPSLLNYIAQTILPLTFGLAADDMGAMTPLIPTSPPCSPAGMAIHDPSESHRRHWVTALSFVEGTVLSDFPHLRIDGLGDVGRCAGGELSS